MRAKRRAQPFDVVGVHAIEPVEQVVPTSSSPRPSIAFQRGEKYDPVADDVPVPQAVV